MPRPATRMNDCIVNRAADPGKSAIAREIRPRIMCGMISGIHSLEQGAVQQPDDRCGKLTGALCNGRSPLRCSRIQPNVKHEFTDNMRYDESPASVCFCAPREGQHETVDAYQIISTRFYLFFVA